MDISKFLKDFNDQFDFYENEYEIKVETEFKSLDDWDSLVALSVIAMIDSEYGVSITGDDIRKILTVGELISLVEAKM
jgi:acyl carrier protein